MKVSCSGTARIQDSETGVTHHMGCEELDWDTNGSGEGPMGPETQYTAVFEHPDLGTLIWSLWEYPVGIQDNKKTDVGKHKLIEDFHYDLQHEPE
jgi:hypothetical protein